MQTTTPDNTIRKAHIEKIFYSCPKDDRLKKSVLSSFVFDKTLKCPTHLEIIHEVETPDLGIGTLLVPAPVDDWTRGAGGVHSSGVPHQQDNLHTVRDISTSSGWNQRCRRRTPLGGPAPTG